VQTLPGCGAPFERLVTELRTRDFCAAAIDAPFSVPADFIPDGGHDGLLALVKRVPRENRPFPDARKFADAVISGRAMLTPKPLRRTEREWQHQGVNVRSTLWAGPRSGAAMTAACLALLSAIQCHLWPWCQYQAGIVAEAFPAAQLKTWRLPHQQYSDGTETAVLNRQRITTALQQRVVLGDFESQVLCSADALDAVLCAFAALAITRGTFIPIPSGYPRQEGWIAVHV
jgi:predicted nuclease with RNAse H fold